MLPLRRFLLAMFIAFFAFPVTANAAQWVDGPDVPNDGNETSNPRLAIGPDGTVTQVWVQDNLMVEGVADHVVAVKAQQVKRDGKLGPQVELDRTVESNADPFPFYLENKVEVATGANGVTAVAWAMNGPVEEYRIGVALFDADGNLLGKRSVATVQDRPGFWVSVGPNQSATLVFTDEVEGEPFIKAARVTPGSHQLTVLGPADDDTVPVVATGAGGVSWVAWKKATGDEETSGTRIVRLAADGSIDVEATPIGLAGARGVTLVTSPDGSRAAVAGILEPTDVIAGVRLNPSGSLLGVTFRTSPYLEPDPEADTGPYQPGLVIGNDGTVTVAEMLNDYGLGYAQFAPTVKTGVLVRIAGDGSTFSMMPALATRTDGTVMLTWFRFPLLDPLNPMVVSRQIAPDGSAGETLEVGRAGFMTLYSGDMDVWRSSLVPALLPNGDAQIGLPRGMGLGDFFFGNYVTKHLDMDPPKVEVSIPATAFVGKRVTFSARVTDTSPVSVAWDLGDGNTPTGTEVSRVFPRTGPAGVTVTVTDAGGNQTVIKRTVKVTKLPGKLKITKATRKGAKVQIKGRINKSASGAVTVTYRQRTGRVTSTKRKLVRINKGSWKATFVLPGRISKIAGQAKAIVNYPGDEDTARAKATRRVTARR